MSHQNKSKKKARHYRNVPGLFIQNIEKFLDAWVELAKRELRTSGTLPEPVVALQYVSWGRNVAPPRVDKLFSLLFTLPPVIARKRSLSILVVYRIFSFGPGGLPRDRSSGQMEFWSNSLLSHSLSIGVDWEL